MTKDQIAQKTHELFCELCTQNELSEEEFVEALETTTNWFDFELKEWK